MLPGLVRCDLATIYRETITNAACRDGVHTVSAGVNGVPRKR